jgi:hypothetical protein
MRPWTTVRETYTSADRAAFCDAAQVDSEFGFPAAQPDRVFSISLNAGGCSNVHEGGHMFRWHYFGNAVAMRRVTAEAPDAWIWDERYRFERVSIMSTAQREFLRHLGDKKLVAIQSAAKAAGFDHRATGRPDLAAFLPGRDPEWCFIEIKIVGGTDKLKQKQIEWLRLLSSVFGRASAIELEVAPA